MKINYLEDKVSYLRGHYHAGMMYLIINNNLELVTYLYRNNQSN